MTPEQEYPALEIHLRSNLSVRDWLRSVRNDMPWKELFYEPGVADDVANEIEDFLAVELFDELLAAHLYPRLRAELLETRDLLKTAWYEQDRAIEHIKSIDSKLTAMSDRVKELQVEIATWD